MSEKNMFTFADFSFLHGCVVVQAQEVNVLAHSEGTEGLFSGFLFLWISFFLSLSCFYLCFFYDSLEISD